MITENMKDKKPAFTLMEILIVVGIIVTLLGMTVQMIGASSEAQGKARAKADMAIISTALEEFKSQNGTYPRISCSASEKLNAAKLYQCLTGRMVMVVEDGSIVFKELTDTDARPALIDSSKMKLANTAGNDDVDPNGTTTFFVDPWGEPYIYVFDTSTTTGKSTTWKSPKYLLLSKGPDNTARATGSLYTDGILDDVDFYKSSDANEDNLLNGID